MLGLCLCLTISTAIAAKNVPTITVSKGDQINLAVSPLGGAEGAPATKVVQNDLALSGYFKLGGADSTYTVRGTASGGSLQGQVVDHGGGTVLAKSYSGSTRENAHQFANDIIETLTGQKGIAGTKIAFIATRSGRKEVYVADCDGSNVRQLTHDNTISVHPSLSPDGRRLAYTGYQSGYADVYVIDLAKRRAQSDRQFPGHKQRRGLFARRQRACPNDQQRWQPGALHRKRERWRGAAPDSHPRRRVGADLVAEWQRDHLLFRRRG